MSNKRNYTKPTAPEPWPDENGPRSRKHLVISYSVLGILVAIFLVVFWKTVLTIIGGAVAAAVCTLIFVFGEDSNSTSEEYEDGWRHGHAGYGYYRSGMFIMDEEGNDSTYL